MVTTLDTRPLDCPNCESRLPHDDIPQTCEECGFTIEVFVSKEEAARAVRRIERGSESIVTAPVLISKLGWIVAHTSMLLV